MRDFYRLVHFTFSVSRDWLNHFGFLPRELHVMDDSFVLFDLSMEIHLAFEKIGHAQKVAFPRPAAISGYG